MKASRRRIAAVIDQQTTRSGFSAKKVSKQVAAYLLSEGRVNELDSIMRDLMQRRADLGHVEVRAVSAFPLSVHLQSDIKTRMRQLYPQAKTVLIDQTIDHSLIGGVRLELPNQQGDFSLRAKLNRLKQLTTGKDRF